jgi:hypothetical protein
MELDAQAGYDEEGERAMIAACRQCGKLVEMTTEEAYTPVWSCQWWDRICATCYRKHFNEDGVKE